MPPTATEVNARLLKAVNEEGNVLSMEAVYDMIAWLEKINITMEVLEETRIGKIMNLMRKNLEDKDLAKRVKNLLKKWKKDMEKLKEKNNGCTGVNDLTHNKFNSQSAGLNIIRNIDNNKLAGVKRKQTSAENSPVTFHKTSSPRVSSPSLATSRVQSSFSINSNSSKLVCSSKPQANKVSRKISSPKTMVSSPKNKTKVRDKHARNTPSPLINNTNHNVSIVRKNAIEVMNKSDLKPKLDISNSNGIHLPAKPEVLDVPNEGKIVNNFCKPEEFDYVNKDEDTRTQEDRISSLDSGYQGTLSYDENSPSLSPDDKIFGPIEKAAFTESSSEVDTAIPGHFEPIEPENLELRRKEIPDNPVSPSIEADGVNGVYDEDERFREWTEEIVYKEKDYHVLPYVILD